MNAGDYLNKLLSCKIFKLMRNVLLLIFITAFQAYADNSYSQNTKLSLALNNVKVVDVLEEIQNKSEFYFLFNAKLIDVERRVSISMDDKKISEMLTSLFSGTGVNFIVYDKQIILTQSDIKSLPAEMQQQKITGIVIDKDGVPIPGVTIKVTGTTQGALTDANGKYSIEVPQGSTSLTFSFIGMETQEISIGALTEINVTMAESSINMEELVVVGYGVQKKINLTGSVASVSANTLEGRPISNIGQALQGVVPNLNVSVSNGSPNSLPSFNIRGGTSFTSSGFVTGSPLILVDGIQMDINLLNPEDIDNISVLKDASSAAIYGARAAYGVMLVTTKKGNKAEKARITYNSSFQWNSPTATPDLLDNYTIQDAENKSYPLRNESIPSNSLARLDSISAYNADPQNVAPYYIFGGNVNWRANTDVYGMAVRKISPMQKHNLSLSGGSAKSNYYGSIGYQAQDGLYKINTDKSNRYNAMLNVNSEVSKWFSIEMKSSYNYFQYSEPVSPAGKGGWWTAMSQEPTRNINMPLKTPDYSPAGVMYTDNILSFMDYGSSNKLSKENLVLGVSPVITPLKGWRIKGDFSVNSYNYGRKVVVPELSRIEFNFTNPTIAHTSPSYVQVYRDRSRQFTLNTYTDYALTYNKHDITALVGFNQEWNIMDGLDSKGENILTPSIPYISQTSGNKYIIDSGEEISLRGVFYRFTYSYDGKYLFESNGRYDGTSKFPKNDRFKFFPSFSVAWRVSKESFAQPIAPVVNDLKLRFSYGSLGNQNVANYLYVPTYSTVPLENFLLNGQRPVGVTAPGLVSPTLTWESARTIDFGVDITLFKRLDLTFDWYNRTTSDILVDSDKFPAVLGTSAPTKNSGELKTIGWELIAKWRDGLQNGLNYNITFTLSDYQTSVTTFDGNPNLLLSTLYAGQKMGEIWGYETIGTFQTQDDIDAAPSQSQIDGGKWYPGDIQYKDLNGDGTIGSGLGTVNDPGDRKVIGNSTPRFQFGLNMNASYKGFDLNLFFQGVGKRDFWINNQLHWGLIANTNATGTWEVYNNSWTPDRTDAFYPAYKNKGANILQQTKYLQNAAYIRLKNITLGYTLPKKLTQVLNIEQLRVFVSTYNIWSHSKLPAIFDPEILTADYPMIKSVALGLQVSF
ncbi:MAG: SusC/RagA family TonB-linked outer membrane protein [Bacteroidales bacterium]|nr:MAG: SusC/RagA family TonB-linked outer membrane protein [Bacteroidales bacterium]